MNNVTPIQGVSTSYNANPGTLMKASNQWASRPDDERFLSLQDLHQHTLRQRHGSKALGVSSRQLEVAPVDNGDMAVIGPNGNPAVLNNWSFGQLAQRAGAPSGYLRQLPAELAADNLNYGLQHVRDVEDIGVLLTRGETGVTELRAATGPRYGRIWNSDIVGGLVRQFGDGVNGRFKVPGEFGKDVPITKANTTLYAGDRDMFVFLADEKNRIEIPNRRNGETGSLARGFFVWNSEVGAATFGVATFLFDFVCMNRIVWGAREYGEIRIRHTAGAPDRFLEQVTPALDRYANDSTHNIVQAISDARQARIDDVDSFLNKRFTKAQARKIQAAHLQDEGRPIETLWDVTTGVTAYAREIPNPGERVVLERAGGEILDLAR